MKKFIMLVLLSCVMLLPIVGYASEENDFVSRAELAHIAMDIYEYVTQTYGMPSHERPVFNDISDSQYAYRITQAYISGFVNGVGEMQFAPEVKVTNSQVITVFYRVMQKLNLTQKIEQSNNKNQIIMSELNGIPEWARAATLYMAEFGIVDLKDEKFSPDSLMKRTEINNLADKIKAFYVDPSERSEYIDYETWFFNQTGYKLFAN